MAADRIPVPRMVGTSVSMWLSAGAAALSVPAVMVWSFLTQPTHNFVVGTVLTVFAVAVVGGLIARRTWLDPVRGELVREVWGVWRRPVAWADAEVVRVRSNNGGQALLQVRGAGRRTSTYLPLVAVDLGGDRSQSPDFLRVLADQIETWAPQFGAVVRALRAQADHVASGGTVRESPLARAHLTARR